MKLRWHRRRRGVPLSDIDRGGVVFLLADVEGTLDGIRDVFATRPGDPMVEYLGGSVDRLSARVAAFREGFLAHQGTE